MGRFRLSQCGQILLFDGDPLLYMGDIELGCGMLEYGRGYMMRAMVESLNNIKDFPTRKSLEDGEHDAG